MLKTFTKEFYESRYINFSRLNKFIRQVFNKLFRIKNIYMDRFSGNINSFLASFVINQ